MKRGLYHFERPVAFRLSLYLLILLTVLISGTAGYYWIEGWSLVESLYMTVITVSTVGFKEVHELSAEGRLFTVLLIFFGVSAVALSVTALFEYFVLNGLTVFLGRGKMDKQMQKLSGHIILCGFGRTGYYIARDLKKAGKPFVVIENDPERIQILEKEGFLFLPEDPASEDSLEAAGIARAGALVAAMTKDADNLFLTLSARSLNPRFPIIARVQDPENGRKFIKAGATRVVSPFSTGATRIVQLLLRPAVVDLIELVAGRENLALEVCEITVDEASGLANRTLAESRVRQSLGCMVFAVKRSGGEALFDPDPQMKLLQGDVLVALQKPAAVTG